MPSPRERHGQGTRGQSAGTAWASRRSTASAVPRGLRPPHTGRRAARWQVFGLVGVVLVPTGRRFPGPDGPVLCDGGRSHSPLRGSPGFTPGSLLPRPPWTGGRTSCGQHHIWVRRRKPQPQMVCSRVSSRQFVENAAEDLRRAAQRLGVDEQPADRGGVAVDVLFLVDVEAAGQVLDVDHVGQLGVGEAQDAERAAERPRARRSRTASPGSARSAAGCSPAAPPPARAAPRGRRSAGAAPPRPAPPTAAAPSGRWSSSLRRHPQLGPPVDLLAGRGVVAEPDHRPGVRLGLQQPGDELDLVGADQFGGLFQVEIVVEPGVQHVAVGVPPARGVGLPGEREQLAGARSGRRRRRAAAGR